MSYRSHRWLGYFCVTILTTNILVAQDILDPPFGLHWGDSPEKLLIWATRQSLNVTILLPGNQPTLRILKIFPNKGLLPETKAGAVEGRFVRGKLYEVAIHYVDPTATAEEMEVRFEALRRQTTNNYGPLLPNQQQRVVNNQFVTRTLSFHRETLKGQFLLLTFTEEQDLLRKSSEVRFSLVYQNDNFKTQPISR